MKPLNMSASQIKQWRMCEVRWAFNRIERRREESGAAADRGTAIHKEMELYANLGLEPKSPHGRMLKYYAPPPGIGVAEHKFTLSLKSGPFVGAIDHVTALRDGRYVDIHESDVWLVVDWKTTSNLDNALTPAELREDPAANLYAYAAYEAGARVVCGRWVYVCTRDTPNVRDVFFQLDRQEVYARVAELDAEAMEPQRLFAIQAKPTSLTRNTESCFAFRRECPFKEECQPQFSKTPFKVRSEITMEPDFLDHLSTIGNKVTYDAPPPPPADDDDMPPPPPADDDTPPPPPPAGVVGESGFVNPPEAVRIPVVVTPEEMAFLQGVAIPVPTLPDINGPLDSYSLPELRMLAEWAGITFMPRTTSKTLVKQIRAYIATTAAEVAVENNNVPESMAGDAPPARSADVLLREIYTLLRAYFEG